jgi:hypothetical protein
MPRFGGFNLGNIGGALGRNALGTIANAVLPRTTFGGFGLPGTKATQAPQQNAQDRVVSLRPKPAAANRVYGDGLLRPLKASGGLIWPYTPAITYQHPITYETVSVTHANQDFHIYSRTPAVILQVSGEFTVQNQLEGAYAMAAIHFFRTLAKMNFGETDPQAGTPPPVLLFNAYGPFVFKDVPVIVKDFSTEFPQDVDYVQVAVSGVSTQTSAARVTDNRIIAERLPPIPANVSRAADGALRLSGAADASYFEGPDRRVLGSVNTVPGVTSNTLQSYTVWLPAVFKITCSLVVQHTPNELRKRFNLPKYINGDPSQKDFV